MLSKYTQPKDTTFPHFSCPSKPVLILKPNFGMGIQGNLTAHSIHKLLLSSGGLEQAADCIPSILSFAICPRRPATRFQDRASSLLAIWIIYLLVTGFQTASLSRLACRMYCVTGTQKWLLCTPVVSRAQRCNTISLSWFEERMFIKYILLLVRGWFLNKQTSNGNSRNGLNKTCIHECML